tara:strand:- start:42 stop:365 length:324 start_codon:yes stop_codon:yes gene_type:complete
MGAKERRKGATYELEIAHKFGTERVGSRGKEDHIHSDVEHESFYIQCKRRASIASYKWWTKTSEFAKTVGKIPIVVMREDRGENFVMISLDDFLELVDGKEEEQENR